jgi:hypothetical protein
LPAVHCRRSCDSPPVDGCRTRQSDEPLHPAIRPCAPGKNIFEQAMEAPSRHARKLLHKRALWVLLFCSCAGEGKQRLIACKRQAWYGHSGRLVSAVCGTKGSMCMDARVGWECCFGLKGKGWLQRAQGP